MAAIDGFDTSTNPLTVGADVGGFGKRHPFDRWSSRSVSSTGGPIRRAIASVLGLAACGALLAFLPGTSVASDFYKITIIAESPQTVSTDWRILGTFVGINDAGVATWNADRFVNGAFEGGILTGNGITQTTIATGPVQTPSINNLGQVTFVEARSPASLMRLWDKGTISTLYTCQLLRCYSGGLSDNTRVALLGITNPNTLSIVGAGGQVTSSGTFPVYEGFGYPDPAISRNGLNAAMVGLSSASNYDVYIAALDQTRPNQLGRLALGSRAEWGQVIGLSTNDLGNIAFLSYRGAVIPGNVARAFVGVVNARTATPSLIRVADTSDGTFNDFGSPPNGGVAINNLNEVAFEAVAGVANTSNGVYIGDVSGRKPLPVVVRNEVIAADGTRFTSVDQAGFVSQAINNKGQIAFGGGIQRGSTNYYAILRADPIPGVSPGNPILPASGTPLPSGWRFTIPFVSGGSAVNTSRRYIDPPLAVGYEYKVEAPGPNFATVYVPAPLANGDDTFSVEFNGQVAPLRAGEVFDFTTVVPGGVSSFRVTGIDTTEALDPINPQAFVTGLTFVPDPTADFNVTMVPIVADPSDTDLDGVPNAIDLCPNTAPGAVVDANGCSASQRDSDGDGVVDSLDKCPATPRGTQVDANGCSALQLDADGDGVPNTIDACPNTPPGATVNAVGCALSQLDSDGDGVNDAIDQCPNTPAGAAINAVGCALSQLDSDHDSVNDAVDKCPNTPAGATVNADGCAASQLDSDGDGVPNSIDQCPNTPAGAAINAVGCALSQLDSDGDGVPDSIDACPGTPAGTLVDARGCPLVVQPPRVCDVDANKSVNYKDIEAILRSLGQRATGTSDPRDANRDGKITLLDAAICVQKCDRWLCR